MGSKVSKKMPENALEVLRKFDTILIVDDSTSMTGARWHNAGKALANLAVVASKYDSDGIEIQFLNSPQVGKNLKSAKDVNDLFNSQQPVGGTPIARKLESLITAYINTLDEAQGAEAEDGEQKKRPKPVNFIVITDGAPTDDPEAVIVKAAQDLDARNMPLTQLGIQFVQIGSDPRATKYLESLDNSLRTKHNIRDIVDTTLPEPGEKLDMIKILTGGVNRRVDNKGTAAVTS